MSGGAVILTITTLVLASYCAVALPRYVCNREPWEVVASRVRADENSKHSEGCLKAVYEWGRTHVLINGTAVGND